MYEKRKNEGTLSSEERVQADAKSELERYGFYFTRYDNHIKAISQMKKTLEEAEAIVEELWEWFTGDHSGLTTYTYLNIWKGLVHIFLSLTTMLTCSESY